MSEQFGGLRRLLSIGFVWVCAGGCVPPWTGNSVGGLSARVESPPGDAPTPGISEESTSPELLNAPAYDGGTRSTTDKPSAAEVPLYLPHFYRELKALKDKRRQDHVRVLWYGDSHTAADFFSGVVRKELQAEFGNAGPGFVHLGDRGVRHETVASVRSGRWKREPKSPASYEVQGDGVYGLAGVRTRPLDVTARVDLHFRFRADAVPLTWEIIFRPTGNSFRWSALREGAKAVKLYWSKSREVKGAKVRRRASQLLGWQVDVARQQELSLRWPRGPVEVFGAIGESRTPGLVLDALGINGARIRTMLGWHEGIWVAEVAERDPQLIILAYGTNEVGDGARVSSYEKYFEQVVARYSEAGLETDCLLIGPTDRRDREGKSLPRVAEIDAMQRRVSKRLGCGYFSLLDAMGGDGGYTRWAQAEPPKAGRDGVHLTRAGYEELAKVLSGQLLGSYRVMCEKQHACR